MQTISNIKDHDIFDITSKDTNGYKNSAFISGILEKELPQFSVNTFIGEDIELLEKENPIVKTAIYQNFELRKPIISIPKYSIPRDTSISLQKWEGVVKEIHRKVFVASLTDLSNNNLPEAEAEFLIEDVSDDDKELLKPGAVFYWNIHYYVTSGGQRNRTSSIRFRRLPIWTKKNIETAKIKAFSLIKKFEHQ